MTEFRPGRFEILPLVIKNLVIINVLFFLAQNTVGNSTMFDMSDLFALHHVKSPLFKPWQLVTYLFMHANIGHIFFNMLMLWMFGSVLENLWGPQRFLLFYFLCGIGAALFHLTFSWYDNHDLLNNFMLVKQNASPGNVTAFFKEIGYSRDPGVMSMLESYQANPNDPGFRQQMVETISNITNTLISRPTIGASGAVFGIMAAFVYLFPNSNIYLYFLFPIKAKWLGILYFGVEIYNAILNNPGDDIARWAHIGGGLVGFLLVLTWNKRKRNTFY
jgi:membrane associated rhomboid family serine protease